MRTKESCKQLGQVDVEWDSRLEVTLERAPSRLESHQLFILLTRLKLQASKGHAQELCPAAHSSLSIL